MRDKHLGAAVLQDVGDLVALEMPVDRDGIGADAHGGERGFQKSEVVAQQQRDAVTLAHAEGRESGGGAQDTLIEGGTRQGVRSPLTSAAERGAGAGAVVMCG